MKISTEKKIIGAFLGICILAFLGHWAINGITQKGKMDRKHLYSSGLGLDRIVYWAHPTDSTKDMTWEGRFKVEHNADGITFLDSENKAVIISTGYYVVEK